MSNLLLAIAAEGAAPGKAIAMDLEKYGDVKVLRVEVWEAEQIRLEEN